MDNDFPELPEVSDDENFEESFEHMNESDYRSLVYLYFPDDETARQLAATLAMHHHEVVCFDAADELQSAIVVRAPQALVMDIDSPAGQIARKKMGNRVISNFPIIYISAIDDFMQRLAAVREGAEGYFLKPLDADALSARIDEKIARNEVMAYRVLVVDDDEMLASYYEAILSSAGMHVKAINDPVEVLDALKKFKPELVLTDLNMPVCNGLEMAQIIRQNNRYLDIPIVFLSSDTQKEMLAIETGADDFLSKPIDPEKLISTIASRAERYRNLRKQR
ncbi:response regulator [Undibacterium pigrum]|uniref:Response regulator receiver domain-containing protein n=1 Tax=Undibacterium pigrum TaxID=401470 RepID=A0A318JAU7_9BURK|nr:response regulator [Undibacterium pigrum]PXX43826.1 response regulator receiver domain-containing protein [Undibacterium pigrum]